MILRDGFRRFRFRPLAFGDMRINPQMLLQIPPEPEGVIAFIGVKRVRAPMNLRQQYLDLAPLIDIGGRGGQGERLAVGIDKGMDRDALAFVAVFNEISAALARGKKSRPRSPGSSQSCPQDRPSPPAPDRGARRCRLPAIEPASGGCWTCWRMSWAYQADRTSGNP